MSEADAYAECCVHGTLPLVRDDGAPSGMRFARIGVDDPSDCIADPSGLPDAEMTMRTFGSAAEVAPYLAALSDHGGNAFSALAGPSAHAVPFVIVLRHDRPRVEGPTLDDAVRLINPSPGLAQSWDRHRRLEGERIARQRFDADLGLRWKHEADAVMALPDAFLANVGTSGVEFISLPGMPSFLLTRDGSDPVLTWKERHGALPADLSREFEEALAAEGVSRPAQGGYAIVLDALRPEALAEATERVRRIGHVRERLDDVEGTRTRLSAALADRSASRMLARAVAGIPVLQFGTGDPAAQASPRTGTAQTVAGSLLSHMLRLRLMRPVWEPPPRRFGDGSALRYPGIYEATEAARALVTGTVEEAARLAGNTRLHAPGAGPTHAGELSDALAAMASEPVPALLSEAAAAASERLPPDGENLRRPRGQGYEGWMPLVLCVLAGRAGVDDEGRLRTEVGRDGPRLSR